MAAVRCAARRLGGSLLQRAQAAATSPLVAEERRQLMPRRFLSQDKNANHAAVRRVFKEYPESEIQQKKEELYTLISEADKQFLGATKNRQLLVHLSGHVEPRLHDPEWRRLSTIAKATKWLWWAGNASWVLIACICCWDNKVRVAELKNASRCDEAAIAQHKNAACGLV